MKIDKELAFLFLGTSFLKIYLDGTSMKSEKIDKLLMKISKISFLYSKRLNDVLIKSESLMNQVETEARALINVPVKNKFEKRIIFDSQGDLVAHGLGLSLALLLEHQELHKRSLLLPYKEITKIYDDLSSTFTDELRNAKIIASQFRTKVLNNFK